VHYDVRVEGKGRSMKLPHKRLKFENVPIVVPLLFVVCTHIASLTDYGKVAKITGRRKKSVHKCQRMYFPVVIISTKADGKANGRVV